MRVVWFVLQLVEAAEDAEVAQEYAGKLVKMVVDTNLNAQQKGIEVASACARKMNVDAVAGWVHSVMAKTVDKAFGQVKCKGTAQELAMLLIEAEQGEMVSPRSASLCDVDESPAELRDCGTRGVPRRSEPPHLHLRAVSDAFHGGRLSRSCSRAARTSNPRRVPAQRSLSSVHADLPHGPRCVPLRGGRG